MGHSAGVSHTGGISDERLVDGEGLAIVGVGFRVGVWRRGSGGDVDLRVGAWRRGSGRVTVGVRLVVEHFSPSERE
jgi:hypothetical protein